MRVNYLFYICVFILSYEVFSQEHEREYWTIEKCIDYASENNLSVQHNRLNEKLVERDRQLARNSWLPVVTGNFDNNFTIGQYNQTVNSNYYQYSNAFGVQSNINVYSGGKVRLRKEKADIDLQAAKVQTDITINDISIKLTDLYITILLNKELKKVAEENLEVSKTLLEFNKKRLEEKKISDDILAQSEAEVAQDERTVVSARIQINRSLLDLALLLQLDNYNDFDIADIKIPDELTAKPYDFGEILNYATINQPIVKNDLLQIKSAEKETKLAKASLLPTVTGIYNFGTNYAQFLTKHLQQKAYGVQFTDNLTHLFGLSVRVPIWNQNIYKINVQKAKINQDMVFIDYKQAKQDVIIKVQSAYFEETSSFDSYTSLKEAYKYAKISYDFALKSYNSGKLSLYDFNRSRTDMLAAKTKMLEAKYNYIYKQKILDFYAGNPITLERA